MFYNRPLKQSCYMCSLFLINYFQIGYQNVHSVHVCIPECMLYFKYRFWSPDFRFFFSPYTPFPPTVSPLPLLWPYNPFLFPTPPSAMLITVAHNWFPIATKTLNSAPLVAGVWWNMLWPFRDYLLGVNEPIFRWAIEPCWNPSWLLGRHADTHWTQEMAEPVQKLQRCKNRHFLGLPDLADFFQIFPWNPGCACWHWKKNP